MKSDNLVGLIELLAELEDVELDPRLKDGEVYTSDGRIVTL
jgi:hypothetical protein